MTDMTDTNTTESTTRKDNMTADHINHADRTDNGEHAIIAVEHVTFGYKKKQTVLEDIDFTVPARPVAGDPRIQRRRQDHAVQTHRRTAAPP